MTPRHEVELIDLSDDFDTILQQARESRRSRLPLRDGGPDEVVGVISVKDILMSAEAGTHDALRALIREAPVVLDLSDATQVIDSLRGSLVHMVLVYDEYGHFQGIVTPMDVLEAITGAFRDEEVDEPACVERPDGSLLVAGWMAVDEFAERVNLPLPEDRDFDTVAGLVLDRMGRLPALGESVAYAGYQMEVVDMDGMRIDKLLVSRINPFVVTQTGDEL
jgi:putative hemolysin